MKVVERAGSYKQVVDVSRAIISYMVSHARFEWIVLALMLTFHIVGAVTAAVSVPFPSPIDELQHYSYIRQMLETPVLFPDYRKMQILSDDLHEWSLTHSYLNHPPLYYLLLAPLAKITGEDVFALRLVNIALSTVALLIAAIGGRPLFPSPRSRALFYVVLFAYPKAAIVGGMINNDNFTLLAGAIMLFGLIREKKGFGWVAFSLVLAGWGKLTALLMLGSTWGVWRLGIAIRQQSIAVAAGDFAICLAVLIAAAPYLHNLAAHGQILIVSDWHNFVPPAERPALGLFGFLSHFLTALAAKWSALEGNPRGALSGLLVLALTGYSLFASTSRYLATAYLTALAIGLLAHIVFGWLAFQRIGDLTSAQSRYYNVLWPGLAAGASLALAAMPQQEARRIGVVVVPSLLIACIQVASLIGIDL